MTMQMRTSQQPPLKLFKQSFSTFGRSDEIESIITHAYPVRCRPEAFPPAAQFSFSTANAFGAERIGVVGNG
jgi:hypothetical protein